MRKYIAYYNAYYRGWSQGKVGQAGEEYRGWDTLGQGFLKIIGLFCAVVNNVMVARMKAGIQNG